MTTRILFILFAASILGPGCNIINPKESIPTYVHIDSFTFINPDPALTGTGRQEINSAWAYIDGENVGVFDLPATIPVLFDGKKQLQLAPGVNNQGLQDYKQQYPLFDFYNIYLDAQPGKVINVHPETKYVDNLKYWNADFEGGNLFQKLSGDTSIRWVGGADSVFEGGKAGCISLNADPNINIKNAESFAPFDIKPGTQGFLEIHYKGNLSFQVGILVTLPSTITFAYLAGVKPKDEWGKFYVNIQQYTSAYPTALKFSVLIKASLDEGQTDGYVLLDNIKVVAY